MTFNHKILSLFHSVFIAFFLNCAAFSDTVISKERKFQSIGKEKVRIVFTGFYRYEQEKNTIAEIFLKEGIVEDPDSNLELEVILQKKNQFINIYSYID